MKTAARVVTAILVLALFVWALWPRIPGSLTLAARNTVPPVAPAAAAFAS
jgi:hypothetical protein